MKIIELCRMTVSGSRLLSRRIFSGQQLPRQDRASCDAGHCPAGSNRSSRTGRISEAPTVQNGIGRLLVLLWVASFSASAAFGSEALIQSISEADVVSVRALLDAGADPDFMDEEGRTPLTAAVTSLDDSEAGLEILRMLINSGVDLDADYEGGVPPLALLTLSGLFSMNFTETLDETEPPMTYVGVLIGNGADPHALANRANSPIDGESAWSTAVGWTELARILIGAGADVNGRSPEGRTPLMLAVTDSIPANTDMIQYLVDNGASLDLQDETGQTALLQALCGPHEVDYLMLRDDVLRSTENAVRLIELGADVNLPDNGGVTPLMQAVKCLTPENIVAILESGAGTDPVDGSRRTALFYVASGLIMREQELSRGADLPAIGPDGLQGIVDLLLAAGIDPGLADTAGETALAAARRLLQTDVTSPTGASDMQSLIAILETAPGR